MTEDCVDAPVIVTFVPLEFDMAPPDPLEMAEHSFSGNEFWADVEPDPRERWRWLSWLHRSTARRRREPGCLIVTRRRHGLRLASHDVGPAVLWERLLVVTGAPR